jgi:hypothetical protein
MAASPAVFIVTPDLPGVVSIGTGCPFFSPLFSPLSLAAGSFGGIGGFMPVDAEEVPTRTSGAVELPATARMPLMMLLAFRLAVSAVAAVVGGISRPLLPSFFLLSIVDISALTETDPAQNKIDFMFCVPDF